VQGTPNSSRFNIVLKPNGQPADGRHQTPRSPLTGGGILGAGYGIGLAPDGNIWMGNFGWGNDDSMPSPDGNGSVSEFSGDGTPVSGRQGYQGGVLRAQATVADSQGNIWIASYGNDRVYVFPGGNSNQPVFFQGDPGSGPFDIQIAPDDTAWVTYSGGLRSNGPSSVARYALVDGKLEEIFHVTPGGNLTALKGFALDSQGFAWVASGDGNCVCLFSETGDLLGTFNGGGINTPWSTTIDGDDHIWVANFGPMTPNSDYVNAGISKLAGTNSATRPPGADVGDPISPATGYTLPSAGEEVLLHN